MVIIYADIRKKVETNVEMTYFCDVSGQIIIFWWRAPVIFIATFFYGMELFFSSIIDNMFLNLIIS
jgi:hypothetical protein